MYALLIFTYFYVYFSVFVDVALQGIKDNIPIWRVGDTEGVAPLLARQWCSTILVQWAKTSWTWSIFPLRLPSNYPAISKYHPSSW